MWMTSAFSKASVFTVHTKTIGLRFQMSPLWTAFSNTCVFDEMLLTSIVVVRDDRRKKHRKVCFFRRKCISVDVNIHLHFALGPDHPSKRSSNSLIFRSIYHNFVGFVRFFTKLGKWIWNTVPIILRWMMIGNVKLWRHNWWRHIIRKFKVLNLQLFSSV